MPQSLKNYVEEITGRHKIELQTVQKAAFQTPINKAGHMNFMEKGEF